MQKIKEKEELLLDNGIRDEMMATRLLQGYIQGRQPNPNPNPNGKWAQSLHH